MSGFSLSKALQIAKIRDVETRFLGLLAIK